MIYKTMTTIINGRQQMVEIYTIQIKVAQKLGLVNDENYLDTTVKSGDPSFAPTWKIVMGVKKGAISEDEYTAEYLQLMEKSYNKNPQRWQQVLDREKVILACYCRAGIFCHRHLLTDLFVERGAQYIREIRGDEHYP